VEPIYGLAVTGVVDPKKVKRNSCAQEGDVLILGKPLGIGIFSAAFKKDLLDEAAYRLMIETTTQLNLPGMEFANLPGVHAMTDVTGFGLLGHLLEMCRGSGLGARIEADRVPLLPGVSALAESGIATGASGRNWRSYGSNVRALEPMSASLQSILTDPQTSGGLLVACDPESCPACKRSLPALDLPSLDDRLYDPWESGNSGGVATWGLHSSRRLGGSCTRDARTYLETAAQSPSAVPARRRMSAACATNS